MNTFRNTVQIVEGSLSKMNDMWKMFEKCQRSANPYALEDHVNELINMAMQKTAGQNKSGNRKDIPFELLDMIKWVIICEACYMALDERWDQVKEIFKDE